MNLTHVTVGRRTFLKSTVSLLVAVAALPSLALADDGKPTRPDRKLLQAGDFIWPKVPGQIIPYNSSGLRDELRLKKLWEDERDAFVKKVDADPKQFAAQVDAANTVRYMTYPTFVALYMGEASVKISADPRNQSTLEPSKFGSSFYVGHVAIVAESSENPMIIEAVNDDPHSVRTIRYDDWLTDRKGAHVWLGRVAGEEAADRSKIVAEAEKHLGRPYDFWNFDLNDDSGFYCSKLAWMSVKRALGIALDGKTDAKRSIWFSPKQLLHCKKTIDIVFSPGDY